MKLNEVSTVDFNSAEKIDWSANSSERKRFRERVCVCLGAIENRKNKCEWEMYNTPNIKVIWCEQNTHKETNKCDPLKLMIVKASKKQNKYYASIVKVQSAVRKKKYLDIAIA